MQTTKQKPGESVIDFGQRLLELARVGHSASARDEKLDEDVLEKTKEISLKDALARGINNDLIAVAIITNTEWTFEEALTYATTADSAYEARKTLTDTYLASY